MKKISLAFIKRAHLNALKEQLSNHQETIKSATDFVNEIEAGNLEVRYKKLTSSEAEDTLGNSLESMRNKLKAFSMEEKQRHWATEGLARFVEILRSGSNIQSLADDIISNLVKYMQANQGALYVVNDENGDLHLEMIGCYAYNRKKHLSQRIEPGQGITGQVLLEKGTVYMTDIPKDYLKITSGLGEALPRNLLIVPLKINEEIFGVVELASFQEIKAFQIQFVESLAESIASAISSVKNMIRTQKLLEESQMQSEQMRAVEEEMRQNMEELNATQEEMRRSQKRTEQALQEVSAKETYMYNMLNASSDGILTVDRDMRIVLVNEVIKNTFRQKAIEVEPGFPVTGLANPGEEEDFLKPYRTAFKGEIVEVEKNYFDQYYLITYNPLRNEDGQITGVSVFTKETTEHRKLQLQNEKIMKEEQERMKIVERNGEILKALVKNPDIQNGNLQKALENITTTLAKTLGISRSAIWAYNSKNESIVLEKMFISENNSHINGGELFRKDLPLYFKSVVEEEVIAAADTFQHPSLIEFRKGYLDVYDIRSMLDVPFFLDGKVGGVICCENQKENKHWTSDDVNFAKSVADLITIAYKSAQSKKLLDDAQQMAEELRAQEEEIRQNMEELSATQDELHRQMSVSEKVRTELEQRQKAFESANLVWEADELGSILLVNERLCAVSGFRKEELLGKQYTSLHHLDMPRQLSDIFRQAIAMGEVSNGIVRNQGKDGSSYWVNTTIMPIRNEQGKLEKIIGVSTQIDDEEAGTALFNKQAVRYNLPLIKSSLTVAV